MLRNGFVSLSTLMLAMLLAGNVIGVAHADDDDYYERDRGMRMSESYERGGEYRERGGEYREGGESRGRGNHSGRAMVINAKWKEECGSCHMAYPPQFLPVESWRALMAGLDKHFGSNASLEPAVASEIGSFLEQYASSRPRPTVDGKEPALRISDTRWFHAEHREVSSREWKNPKVKSPSNCNACHTGADKGSFSEHEVRIPR
jgi:hypothetical protein